MLLVYQAQGLLVWVILKGQGEESFVKVEVNEPLEAKKDYKIMNLTRSNCSCLQHHDLCKRSLVRIQTKNVDR